MKLPFASRPDTHKRHLAREALKKARKKAINEEEEVQTAAVAALPPPPEGRPYVDIGYRNSWEPRQYQGKAYKRVERNLEKRDKSVKLIKERKRPFDAYYDHPDRKKEQRERVKIEEPDDYEEEEEGEKKEKESSNSPIKQEIMDSDEDNE